MSRRQETAPQVIDLNQLIADLARMLRNVVGEDIEVVMERAPELGLVKVYSGQIEQVLMNLIVNCRDAMPQGGKLKVSTSNISRAPESNGEDTPLRRNEYVQLTLDFTGADIMDLAHSPVCGPFPITMEECKGTGLGLESYYSIIKQNGGEIKSSNQSGCGFTFDICLPQVLKEDDDRFHDVSEALLPRGSETVLLVEHEPLVLNLVSGMLADLGYDVIRVTDGYEALRMAGAHEIHLLLADSEVPCLGGMGWEGQLKGMRPGAKILLTPGSPDEDVY